MEDKIQDMENRIERLEQQIRELDLLIRGMPRGKAGRKFKCSPEQKKEIIKKRGEGVSYAKLEKEYGICRTTIYNICKGQNKEEQIMLPVIRQF